MPQKVKQRCFLFYKGRLFKNENYMIKHNIDVKVYQFNCFIFTD